MNIYVSEATIPQIAAIRYCTLEKKKNPCPTFPLSRLRAAVCRISAQVLSIIHFARFCSFSIFAESIYHQISFETRSKHLSLIHI